MEVYVVIYWKDGMDPETACFNNEDSASLCSGYFRSLGYSSTFTKRGVASIFRFNARKDGTNES